jgi:hypothetical protein
MLNQIQNAELTRALRFKKFMNDNATIFNGYAPFKSAYDSFIVNTTTLETQATLKEASGKGITITKDGLKRKVSADLGEVLAITLEYAKAKKDDGMITLVKFPESYVYKLDDANVLPFITNLINKVFTTALLTNADFVPYGITAAKITAIVADATSFDSKIGNADVVDASVSTANKNINDAIDDIHENITTMTNLVSHFKTANPNFIDGFYQNSQLIILGKRHTGIEGIATKDGIPQAGILVAIEGTNKMAVTDKDGHYAIIKTKPGNITIKTTKDGIVFSTKNIQINRGHIESLNFEL